MRGRWHTGVLVVAVLLTGSCDRFASERRGSIDLREPFGASISADGTTLGVEVPTCNGDPVVTVLEQGDDEIRIQVVSTEQLRNGDDCLDSITVRLDAPLGERRVVDLTSGRVLPVDRADG